MKERNITIPTSEIMLPIGIELFHDFRNRNGSLFASLQEMNLTPSHITDKLVLENLHDILTGDWRLKRILERSEGQLEVGLNQRLVEKNRRRTLAVISLLDQNPQLLVHVGAIDWLLGIRESEEDLEPLSQMYGNEQYEHQGTPYEFIRDFLQAVPVQKGDILYDLGSGYGRVPLYAALTTCFTKCKGIEIVPERVKSAQDSASHMGVENVTYEQNHILKTDFSDGNVFFVFNPFIWRTLEQVGEKFKQIVGKRKIYILTWGGPSVAYFERQHWLRPKLIPSKELTRPVSWGLYVFESLK